MGVGTHKSIMPDGGKCYEKNKVKRCERVMGQSGKTSVRGQWATGRHITN